MPEYPHPSLAQVFEAPAVAGERAASRTQSVAAAGSAAAAAGGGSALTAALAAGTVAAGAAGSGRRRSFSYLQPNSASGRRRSFSYFQPNSASGSPLSDGRSATPPRSITPPSPFASRSPTPPKSPFSRAAGVFQRQSLDMGFARSSDASGGSSSAAPDEDSTGGLLNMRRASSVALPARSAGSGGSFSDSSGQPRSIPPKGAAPATLEEAAARMNLFGIGGGTGSGSNLQSQRGLGPAAGLVPPGSSPPGGNLLGQKSLIGGTIVRQQSEGLGAFSTAAAGGGSRVRTADEIRQAYGRPSVKAAEVRQGVLGGTRVQQTFCCAVACACDWLTGRLIMCASPAGMPCNKCSALA